MSATQGLERKEGWLKCRVGKGMFSDELTIAYPPSGDLLFSDFVPKETVRGEVGSVGAVRVSLLERDGEFIAVLPTNYRDVVFISESDVCGQSDR